ncbi:unnamed protein product, partial [Sphacelaria rigidula]
PATRSAGRPAYQPSSHKAQPKTGTSTYTIPRNSDQPSYAAAATVPKTALIPPLRAASSSANAGPAPGLQLTPHERTWLSRTAADYTSPFLRNNHLHCSHQAWNLVPQRLHHLIGLCVD